MCKLFPFLALFALVSCSSSKPTWAPDHYWAAKTWKLVKMEGQEVANNSVALQFDWAGKKFKSSCGCNQVDGKYELIDKKNIRFASLSSSNTCKSEAFEKAFMETLRNIETYELEGNRLLLKKDKKVVMEFQGQEIAANAKNKSKTTQ